MDGLSDGRGRPTRRATLKLLAASAAASQVPSVSSAQPLATGALVQTGIGGSRPRLALVSRHIQWTSADHGLEIAKQAGFPGIIWTVRRGAHIEVSNVTSELPRVVRKTREAGLETPMVITNVGDVDAEGAEPIFATMQRLGIRLYRAGAPRYRYDAPIQPQFDDFRRKLAALAKLNAKYDVAAAFHTHAYADTIGGGAWDLWMLLNDLDPRYIGLNYDIGHVMAKGGAGWRESIRAVGPYLHSVSIKDFLWEKLPAVPDGQWPWRTRLVAPGTGMVNFLDFFRYLQSVDFQGPLENYFEYSVPVPGLAKPFDLLGRDYGEWTLDMPEQTFAGLLRRDVKFYNDVWTEARVKPAAPPFSVKAPD